MHDFDNPALTCDDLARFFGESVMTVREWCRMGRLPAFKIGKEHRVLRSDLAEFIDSLKALTREREEV